MTNPISPDYLLAGNPRTSCDELERLAGSQIAAVRLRVAENPNTPLNVLLDLAVDEDVDIRIAVASNHTCPDWMRAALAKDDSPTVRFALAEDCCTPMDLLSMLLEDENPYVQQAAQRTIDALELERALIEAGYSAEEGDSYKLGSLLTAADLLEETQLEYLIKVAVDEGIPLGQAIVRMKALPKKTITKALMLQSSLRRSEIIEADAIRTLNPGTHLRGCA